MQSAEDKLKEKFYEYWERYCNVQGTPSTGARTDALTHFMHGYMLGKSDGFVEATRRETPEEERHD